MGSHSYSSVNAEVTRSVNHTYTNSIEQNFTQMVEKKVHDSMKSQGIFLREARDSYVNPVSFPIIMALDFTASMGMIPQNLIQEGLPKMVSSIIQGGVQSPAILFLGVGDHECDKFPLQIGQFESGDEELDLWLKRSYLEQGGGSNEGESYSLAHYFAARHTVTDAWEKRKQKGVLITIGDEPNLKTYPTRAIKEIMGNPQVEGFSAEDMLKEVQEKWEVFHINPKASQSVSWRDAKGYWTEFLGQNYIGCDDYKDVPSIVSKLVLDVCQRDSCNTPLDIKQADTPGDDSPQEIL
jgi:hypothetical protein